MLVHQGVAVEDLDCARVITKTTEVQDGYGIKLPTSQQTIAPPVLDLALQEAAITACSPQPSNRNFRPNQEVATEKWCEHNS